MNEQDLIAERKKAAEHNDTARLAALETAALKRLDEFLTDENPVDSDDAPFFFAFKNFFCKKNGYLFYRFPHRGNYLFCANRAAPARGWMGGCAHKALFF